MWHEETNCYYCNLKVMDWAFIEWVEQLELKINTELKKTKGWHKLYNGITNNTLTTYNGDQLTCLLDAV